MTKEFEPEMFDAYGQQAEEASAEQKARMNPERRKAYDLVFKTSAELTLVETSIIDGERDIREHSKAMDHVRRNELENYRPPRTAFDEWKATVKRLPPDPIDPEREALADAAQAKLEAMTVELDNKRDAIAFAKRALPDARRRQGHALADYLAAYHHRPSQSDALHAHAQAEAKRRAENVKAGRRPEQNAPVAAPEYSSNLDAIRANMRGPIGQSRSVGARPGTYPASRYGTKVQP